MAKDTHHAALGQPSPTNIKSQAARAFSREKLGGQTLVQLAIRWPRALSLGLHHLQGSLSSPGSSLTAAARSASLPPPQ